MAGRHRSDGMSGGTRRQSAIPDRPGAGQGQHALRAGGIILRAAVTATYVQLDGSPALPTSLVSAPTAVYCDVLTYSSMAGYRNGPLARVPVMQHLGLHHGHLWLPKASTTNINDGAPIGKSTMDPQDLDGDHVLIQFLEDDLSRPIITGLVPHPRLNTGNDELEVGHRLKLKLADGNPEFWKRNGSFFGFDKDGNFTIDTTRANSGEVGTDGSETPADNAANGNVTVKLNAKTTLRLVGLNVDGADPKFELTLKDNELILKLQDGETLKLTDKDGNATMTVGDGARHVAIVEALQALYTSLQTKLIAFDAHVHPTGVGPSGPPAPLIAAPAWDPAINSTKVKIPNG